MPPNRRMEVERLPGAPPGARNGRSGRHMTPSELRAVVGLSARAGGGRWLRIEGASMRPLLRPGDEVTLAPVERPPERLRLAAYARGGRLALHRVVLRRGGSVVLKGDGAPTAGAPVPVRDLVGRIVARRRDGREIRAGCLRWRAESAWSLACSALRWARHAFLGRPCPRAGVLRSPGQLRARSRPAPLLRGADSCPRPGAAGTGGRAVSL